MMNSPGPESGWSRLPDQAAERKRRQSIAIARLLHRTFHGCCDYFPMNGAMFDYSPLGHCFLWIGRQQPKSRIRSLRQQPPVNRKDISRLQESAAPLWSRSPSWPYYCPAEQRQFLLSSCLHGRLSEHGGGSPETTFLVIRQQYSLTKMMAIHWLLS